MRCRRGVAAAEEQCRKLAVRRAVSEIPSECPPPDGVQRDLAGPQSCALGDADTAGASVHRDVGQPKGGKFANAQSGLQDQLHHRIIPWRQAMRRGAGGAQQRLDLVIGQAVGSAVADGAHEWDMTHGLSIEITCATCPSAEAAQRLQTAIDRRWPLIRGNHVPAIGGESLLREHSKREWAVMSRTIPAEEMANVVAIATHARRGEAIALQAGEKRAHPVWLDSRGDLRGPYWARSHAPR